MFSELQHIVNEMITKKQSKTVLWHYKLILPTAKLMEGRGMYAIRREMSQITARAIQFENVFTLRALSSSI